MFLLYIVVFISITIVAFSLYTGITPMPSNRQVRKEILNSIPFHFKGKIMELGAGFGFLSLPLARRYLEAEVIAYEISPFPWFVLWVLHKFFRFKNLKVKRENFFKAPLDGAMICVCYLSPKIMSNLSKKLEELPKGALVISNCFSMPGWKPTKVIVIKDLFQSEVFVYQKTS